MKIPWHVGYWCEESGEKRDENDVAFGVLSERKRWTSYFLGMCRYFLELVDGHNMVR